MTQDQAFDILKSGANVFLTGEPGSGKTHLVNLYVAYLRSHDIEPAVTASTGIAATHIGGMTIHSWSGIGIRNTLTARDLDHIAQNEYVAKRIGKTRVLIIDEISMLNSNTLSMVDAVCREVRQKDIPFGGLQVVCVGDFFQLPPVSRRIPNTEKHAALSRQSALIPNKEDAEQSARGEHQVPFAFEGAAWQTLNPIVCYLTEQHRQDDAIFTSLLSAIRGDRVHDEHLLHMQSRMIARDLVPQGATTLFPHNADVDQVNSEALERLSGKTVAFTMSSQGPDALIAHLKKGCLSPEKLLLKEGASVMFTKNNPRGGFVNGTLGIIVSFGKESGHPIVEIRNGKRIETSPAEWIIEENGKVRAKIMQVPLRLAWAITVHKSQGMSLDAAVMDLTSVFEFGQGYVALSRVRRLSGLFLLGWNNHALRVHPNILAKDAIFRAQSNEAEKTFGVIPELQMAELHDRFIIYSGGTLKKMKEKKSQDKKTKGSTYEETLVLFRAKKTIAEIAKARGMAQTTILSHIERLLAEEKISRADIMRFLTPALSRALPAIHAAFDACDTDKLTPVFEKLKSAHPWNDLRLARMVRK